MENKELMELMEELKKALEEVATTDTEKQKIVVNDIEGGNDYIYISNKYTVLHASLQDTLIFIGMFLQRIDDRKEVIYFLKEYLRIKEKNGEVKSEDIGKTISDIITKIVLKGDE